MADLFGGLPAPSEKKRTFETLHEHGIQSVSEARNNDGNPDGRSEEMVGMDGRKFARTMEAQKEEEGEEERALPEPGTADEAEDEDVDVSDVIVRLMPLMSSKKKFRKACAIAHRLLASGQIRGGEDALLFYLLLRETVGPMFDGTGAGLSHHDADVMKPYAELLRLSMDVLPPLLQQKDDADHARLCGDVSFERNLFDAWFTATATVYDILIADESYEYSSIVKRVCITVDPNSHTDWRGIQGGDGVHVNAGGSSTLEAAVLACEAAFSRYNIARWSQSSSDMLAETLRKLVHRYENLAPWKKRVDALFERVQARRRGGGGGGARDIGDERTAFERDQSKAAGRQISIRKSLGSQGDRKASAWLG